ncbi:hypothetical protein BaRGS_00039228, partial [Batillaria attramentaria]
RLLENGQKNVHKGEDMFSCLIAILRNKDTAMTETPLSLVYDAAVMCCQNCLICNSASVVTTTRSPTDQDSAEE